MELSSSILFLTSFSLYFLAAIISLALIRRHKLSNIVSNSICIIASSAGIIASLMLIFTGKENLVLAAYKLPVPFVTLNITIDKLSAFFVLALSMLVLSVSLYSIGYLSHYYGQRNVGLFNFLYASFILSMLLVLTAGDAIFFFVVWEAMSLISYFLVVFESEKAENQRAGTLYIIMTHVGTAFLLIAFMIMFSYTKSFDISGSSALIPIFAKNILFILFLIGFGTKAGVIPVHIWLPYAHPAASSNISALMSGIMIKTAIYGMIRFVLIYLNIQQTWWGMVILAIGAVSALVGAAYALMEHNIKRLLAFCSIENIGVILIGLGVSFIAFAQKDQTIGALALTASLFHLFNHTLFKGGLFLGAGAIQFSAHTMDSEELGGLIKKMPVTALFMLIFSLAVSAIIPFNGFVSEWLTYQSLLLNIHPGHVGINIASILSIAALGFAGALAAAAFVKLFGISFLGMPRSEHAAKAQEVPLTMNLGMGILTLWCLVGGLLPMVFIKVVNNVIMSFGSASIIENLQGGVLIAYSTLNVSGNSLSLGELLIVLISIVLVSLVMIRLIGGKYVERKYGTWDCGFEALNSRMQYSATGFSKPLRIVLRILYRPGREIEVEKGVSPYFPASIKYKVSTVPIFEKYIYVPIFNTTKQISRKVKFSVQTGNVHAYLLYIFLAVLAMMLYNRLV